MAVMDAVNRARTAAEVMRRMRGFGNVSKADVRAAVDATDAWIDANDTSYNNALPAAVRTGLTTAQKTELFCYVARRRANDLPARED